MRIQAGAPAPSFQATDLFGRIVDLAHYQGKPLLLAFFRNGACALCNLRVHELIVRHPDFERAGLAVVAIFESPRASLLEHVGRQDAPFPIIADPSAELYDLYGLESSQEKLAATLALPETQERVAEAAAQGFQLTPEEGSNFFRMPADFLIGPDGVVLHAHYASYVWDHMPLSMIDELLGVTVSG